jgi:DNA mismatch endonuclease (patch repair protein)
MRRVRSRDTTPELLLRAALRAVGLRFQTCVDALPGKPDIVFKGRRLAVFVDGEFWHGFQWQQRGLDRLEEQFSGNPSKTYWIRKIQRNQRRDRVSTAALIEGGWTVLRFWEGDVRRNAGQCAEAIASALEDPVSSPVALATLKTFRGVAPLAPKTRRALESQGWRVADSSGAALAVLPFPLKTTSLTAPFVVIETSARVVTRSAGRDLARALRAMNRRGYGVDALIAGAPRRLFIIGVYGQANAVMPESGCALRSGSLAAFITDHPRIRWNFRRLPGGRPVDSPIAWIAQNYLDPAITAALRGTPLKARSL